MLIHPGQSQQLSLRRIFRTWWPLAASWLMMGAELPALSAIVARLAQPEINLAAYGGIVFPLALIIESPIIMLLAASTALSKDWASYRKIRSFMHYTSALLTGLHALVAFSPIYYFVVEKIIGAPQEIIEPGRVGLMIMLPWTWSIAYRRFNQGVLIRFDHSKAVGVGTMVRLSTNLMILLAGYWLKTIPGIIVASTAVATGVVSEAIYISLVVQPVLRTQLKTSPNMVEKLSWRAFANFYFPLAMTSLLMLIVQPIGSAALSRMPEALSSLAVWPVISGLSFMIRSIGVAYNEVVIALLENSGSYVNLRRFTIILMIATTSILLLIIATPLSLIWFRNVSGLAPALVILATRAMWLGLPMPGLSVLQSWFQGNIMHHRQTKGITEAVVVFLITCTGLLLAGVVWGKTIGLYVGMTAFSLASITQTIWLWHRSLPALKTAKIRDILSVT